MKIIIAGEGKVGLTLTRQLSSEGHDLTLIDSNQSVLESSVERYDVMSVHGNCAAMDTLLAANTGDSELLIAATGADEVNLLCCMTAHAVNSKLHTIARIRSPEYAEQAYTMRGVFALSMIVNPEKQAASEIERLLKFPGFLKRDTFAKGRVEIVEIRIDPESRLCNVSLAAMNGIVKCRVLVCAVLRGGGFIAPNGSFTLRSGDRIFVTAPVDNLALLLKDLGILTRRVRRVILAGGGRVSYYLAESLLRDGIDVKLIERDPRRCVQLATLLPSACVVCGDASMQSELDSEGLAAYDAFVSLTGIDELNMVMSLYATSLGVPQVITKLGRMENTRLLDSLPIGSVICPKELCCGSIVRYVRAMQNQTGAAVAIHAIADGQAEAIEFCADETTLHCGEPLKDIRLKKNVLIVCISRGTETEIPSGDSSFRSGDTIIIVSSGNAVIQQLNDIFEP